MSDLSIDRITGVNVTAFSPYQAYPGPAPVLSEPSIYVAVSGPAPQRRLTVFLRFIFAIPHLFLLYWLTLAAAAVLFVGWWGALFTGRLPRFAVTYLGGYLRWAARVHAYNFLLTDVYPPFSMDDDPGYPVRVAIPEPQQLNRAAVFFRCILAIPAGIVGGVVNFGAGTLMAFVAWLITLVAGQLPPSFHQAYVAVIRFQTRYTGYYWMLTPAYPGGLYGDRPGSVAWADQQPAQAPGSGYGGPQGGWAAPAGYGAPQAGWGAPQGYGASAPGYGAPAYDVVGGYGPRPVFWPATWLLPLTSGAKNLVTAFIVLGALSFVGYIAIYAALVGSAVNRINNAASAATAVDQLNTSYNTVSSTLAAAADCNGNLTCSIARDAMAAAAFTNFDNTLAGTVVPASAGAAKAKLGVATMTMVEDYTQLSKATPAQYQSVYDALGMQQTLNGFDQDVNNLFANLQDQ